MKRTAAVLLLALVSCGDSRCALEPVVGPCKAIIPSSYFDSQLGQCASFDWGGCDGVRPFATLSECEQACE